MSMYCPSLSSFFPFAIRPSLDVRDESRVDPKSKLAEELMLEIFSYCDLKTLAASCLVSKNWYRIAGDIRLWKDAIYNERAFSIDRWGECLNVANLAYENRLQAKRTLPVQQFIEDSRIFRRIYPNLSLRLVWVPTTLGARPNERGVLEKPSLTFRTLNRSLTAYYAPTYDRVGFLHLVPGVRTKNLAEPMWLGVTTEILPGSRNKTYEEQIEMVTNLAQEGLQGYDVPFALEAVISNFGQYHASPRDENPFGMNPPTFTRCQEAVQFEGKLCQICVGGLGAQAGDHGLLVTFSSGDANNNDVNNGDANNINNDHSGDAFEGVGIAPVRRFKLPPLAQNTQTAEEAPVEEAPVEEAPVMIQ